MQRAPSMSERTGLLRPFQRFFALEASGSILLLGCALLALVWANSPYAAAYHHLWEIEIAVGAPRFGLTETLHHWINDGLMAVFFFVIGLEIKREILVGELSTLRQAALPLAAAVGGMVVPALIYVAFNAGTPAVRGWGIPMATDIAFALGVLALLGSRAPLGLKIFLTALAIVDDLGAVLVIAFFYTADLSFVSLGVAGGFLFAMIGANRMHVRHPLVYLLLGIGLWVAVLLSGVHATIAGVLSALTIPARRRIDAEEFHREGTIYMEEFREDLRAGMVDLTADQRDAVVSLEEACEAVQTPLQRLEHMLHPWVAFFIMPVFALANAGVSIGSGLLGALANPIALGVGAGLVVGKQVGVLLFSWLAVRFGIATLPAGAGWRQLYGVACLCGIGFTMSLFIANLAFEDPASLDIAKTGILSASLVAGVLGFLILRRTGPAEPA